MKRLTVCGHVSTFTGYGQMLCEIVAGLDRMGVYCSIRCCDFSEQFGAVVPVEIKSRFVSGLQPEPWELLIRSPWQLPTPRKKTIFYTMWESTLLPKQYVALLNKSHQVIVPATWNKVGFERSGVSVPIAVIPLGINEEIFSYIPRRPIDGKFVIGVAGRVCHGPVRKGVAKSIEMFQKSFINSDQVELHVKVHPDDALPEIKDPRIKIERRHLAWGEVRKWFSGIDVFLSMATVEGFGLWQLQAMACGRPVIAASYAGLAEFLNPENGFCVPFKEVLNTDYGGGLWAELSEQSVIDTLQNCSVCLDEVEAKGRKAAEAATSFTWSQSVFKLHRLLSSIGAI